MIHHGHRVNHKRRLPGRWLVVIAIVGLVISSLGCALADKLVGPVVLADGTQRLGLATRTPWPTYTPTRQPTPSPTPTFTLWPTPVLTDTATLTSTPQPTSTPLPVATATATLLPVLTATPWPTPTNSPVPVPPTATPPPTPTPTPNFAYNMVEVYEDYTSNQFLTGYIAIVNAQEIPIGGVKAVGTFEPGGTRHESTLSPWFFDVRTAPGVVTKIGSVKFEPGGIQAGTWFIHLENEQGDRLSQDVAINTDPASPKWFYIKFKQPGPAVAVASAPTATRSPGAAQTTATGGSAATASGGWSFLNVKSMYDPDWESLFVRGEAVNDTASAQRLTNITGTFYDAGGQVIAGDDDADSYWPIYVVPAGGQVPFEITLFDIRAVADFDLQVITQAAGDTVRQDFEFLALDASSDGIDYCVAGNLKNPGASLGGYLVIAAVLYDDQGDVINFDSGTWYPQEVMGDQLLDFEVCVDPLDQAVADYEVRAWGQ